jgi:hypothetical protein
MGAQGDHRQRYDGSRRNPWNEFECGNNYARSMAAYGLILTASGFMFDMSEKMLGFQPRKAGMKRCFWSIGTAWGEFRQDAVSCSLEIASGKLELKKLRLPVCPHKVMHNGREIEFTMAGDMIILPEITLLEKDVLICC